MLPINIIGDLSAASATSLVTNAAQSSPQSPKMAENVFLQQISKLDADISAANRVLTDYVLDNGNVSVHEMVIAMEQAKLSLQIASEVRNKVVEAYKSITSMQV